MKLTGIIITAAFFLLLGIAVPANARQEKQEERAKPAQEQQAKPEKQQQAKAPKQEQQAKPEKQQQAKAPKQEQQAKPERQQQAKAPKQEQQAKPEKQQQAKAPKQEQQAKPEKQQQAKAPQQQHQQQAKGQEQQQAKGQQQGRSSHAPQRTQQAMARQRAQPELRLSERGSGRIPDERFRSSFGHDHSFRMGNPVLVGGYSRFQYSGFWFGFVEPWPAGWYYTDDVYIDYVDGGYYMYNPYYPGARFAISVVL